MVNWLKIWEHHPDIFIAQNWQECTVDKMKELRLPPHYSYYSGGETALRVGIIAAHTLPKEEDFLLAGLIWANRLSNGAPTVIYFVAPDFSPFLLHALSKVGGIFNAKGVYWREKLTPSLYLIPEAGSMYQKKYNVGERKPDWHKWQQELNPVAQQQLAIIKKYFEDLAERGVRCEIKLKTASFLWGNLEIAEIKKKGKRFELTTKTKWERKKEIASSFTKQGWVDAAGEINEEFCLAVQEILDYLEKKLDNNELKVRDELAILLHKGNGVIRSLWGNPWDWPWLPKDRSESWIGDLAQWYYFEGKDQLSVVCPILDKPLYLASQGILLSCVLERSNLLQLSKKNGNDTWDLCIHWLTTKEHEEDLRLWLSWLKEPEKYRIWLLPDNWQHEGVQEIKCRSNYP